MPGRVGHRNQVLLMNLRVMGGGLPAAVGDLSRRKLDPGKWVGVVLAFVGAAGCASSGNGDDQVEETESGPEKAGEPSTDWYSQEEPYRAALMITLVVDGHGTFVSLVPPLTVGMAHEHGFRVSPTSDGPALRPPEGGTCQFTGNRRRPGVTELVGKHTLRRVDRR